MKSNAIVRIVLYSLLIVLILGILVTVTCFDIFSFNTDSGEVVIGEEVSLNAGDISGLNIDWAAGTITIKTADTDQITFSETGDTSQYAMTYKVEGGILAIDYAKESVKVGVNNIPGKDLTITVPLDWVCENLEFDTAAVELCVDGLTVGTLELDGAAAVLDFRGSVDQLDIDGAAVELSITATNCPSRIDVDGASCKVQLTLPADSGFLVETSGLGYSFRSDVDHESANGVYSYGDRGCRIVASGLACDISIEHTPAA